MGDWSIAGFIYQCEPGNHFYMWMETATFLVQENNTLTGTSEIGPPYSGKNEVGK